jgi:hypothetical protein
MLYALDRDDVRRLIEFLYATYCQPYCEEIAAKG